MHFNKDVSKKKLKVGIRRTGAQSMAFLAFINVKFILGKFDKLFALKLSGKLKIGYRKNSPISTP